MDIVSKETRSRMMAAVRSKNTAVEFEIRRRLFSRGLRYRLHARELPGKPDMIFPRHHAVVFIHGCFWHNHDCRFSRLPATRQAWWKKKLEGNRNRDAVVLSMLRDMGWRTLVIWECSFRLPAAIRDAALDQVACRAAQFLLSKQPALEISTPFPSGATIRKSGDWQNGK